MSHTYTTRRRIAQALRGRTATSETRDKMSSSHMKSLIRITAAGRRRGVRRPVLQLTDCGELVATHPSLRAAARAVGVCPSSIHGALRTGRPIDGHRWRYADEAQPPRSPTVLDGIWPPHGLERLEALLMQLLTAAAARDGVKVNALMLDIDDECARHINGAQR